jgi:hypothetical protein
MNVLSSVPKARAAVLGGLVGVLVAIGGGVAYAVHSDKHPTAAPTPTPSGTSAVKPGVRGKVLSVSGNTFTVRTKQGRVEVTIGPATKFGSKKDPQTRAELRPGVRVVVIGPASAPRRIVIHVVHAGSPTPKPTPSSSAA